MKALNCFVGILALCTVSHFFSSCKKELSEKLKEEPHSNTFSTTNLNGCKPEVLALTDEHATFWNNIMQKFYGDDGKVKFIKVKFAFLFLSGDAKYSLNIPWGEMFYAEEEREAYLLDVLTNRIIFDVKFDEQNRPMRSRSWWGPERETATYTFLGSGNKVEEIELETASSSQTLKFLYNASGSLRIIETDDASLTINYWNGPPINGMFALHGFNVHLKLMELLDFLEFPMHEPVRNAKLVTPDFNKEWEYDSPRRTPEAFVYKYFGAFPFTNVYYTGWTCGTLPAGNVNRVDKQKETISDLKQFQQIYPEGKRRDK